MKEERFWSNDLLFAGRISGLKEMRLADQDDPSCFGTGYHHARTPQYVGLEYFSISTTPKTQEYVYANVFFLIMIMFVYYRWRRLEKKVLGFSV